MKRFVLLYIIWASIVTVMRAQSFSAYCTTGQELEYQILPDQQTVAAVGIVGEYDANQLVVPDEVSYNDSRPYRVVSITRDFIHGLNDTTTLHIPNSVTNFEYDRWRDDDIWDIIVSENHPVYAIKEIENSDSYIKILYNKLTGIRLWDTYWEKDTWDYAPIIRFPMVLPEFPGGMGELRKYLAENCQYPEEARNAGWQGVVVVEFVVEKDGSIGQATVIRSVCESLDAEAIRVIKSMPKWKPGEDMGRPCRSYQCLPVTFSLL